LEPELFIIVAVIITGCLVAFLYLIGARVFTRAQLWHLEVKEREAVVSRKWADNSMYLPNERGVLPVPVELLNNPEAWQPLLAIAMKAVEINQLPANVPHTLTYSPHYSNKSGDGAPVVVEPPASLFRVPTFRELAGAGELGHGRFLLGYADGQAQWGDWKQLYSTALGGMSGTGKSTTARFLLGQAALNGCKFVVIDPHADAGEESLAASLMPLRFHMLCDAASSDKGIIETARFVREIGRKRINGDSDRTPVLVAIDETTALLSRSSCGVELSEMIEEIAQEYRKVGVFALCSAQIWLASRSGGSSALRDSFASTYVHRMKRKQAGLLAPTGTGAEIEALPVGSALLWQTSGDSTIVQIPLTTSADIADIAAREGRTPVEPCQSLVKAVSVAVLEPENIDTATVDFSVLMTPKAKRAVSMFLDGAYTTDILREVWGVTGGGPKQMKASRELMDIIRLHALNKGA